jgi:hypothetical protein
LRRTRLLKRRFSSASAAKTSPKSFQYSSTTSLRSRTRQTSYTSRFPGYASNHLRSSDNSETEEELDESYFLRDENSYFPRDKSRTLHYASLPPTPILPSTPRSYSPPPPPPPLLSRSPSFLHSVSPPFSLWDYVREELLATDFDSHQDLKWDRVSNFLNIPLAVEKVRDSNFRGGKCDDRFLFPDHQFWFCPLLGLIPLHVHNSSYPFYTSSGSFRDQSILSVLPTSPTISKG